MGLCPRVVVVAVWLLPIKDGGGRWFRTQQIRLVYGLGNHWTGNDDNDDDGR